VAEAERGRRFSTSSRGEKGIPSAVGNSKFDARRIAFSMELSRMNDVGAELIGAGAVVATRSRRPSSRSRAMFSRSLSSVSSTPNEAPA
jgi:hypothetical protein